MTSLVVHFCSAPLVCFVDALDRLGVGLTQSPLYGSLLWMAVGLISVGNLWWMLRGSNRA